MFLNPLNPKIKIWILICCPLFISYRSSGEKLIKYQANSYCVIMSVILMTTLFYKAFILHGEIWCWSLLRLKGLSDLIFSAHHKFKFKFIYSHLFNYNTTTKRKKKKEVKTELPIHWIKHNKGKSVQQPREPNFQVGYYHRVVTSG